MLKFRIKRRAAASADAVTRLAKIEASVVALNDEDLLDLADIFNAEPSTPLMMIAAREMQKRSISLS